MPSSAVAYLPASRSCPNDRPRYLLTNSHCCRYDQRIGWKGRFRRFLVIEPADPRALLPLFLICSRPIRAGA